MLDVVCGFGLRTYGVATRDAEIVVGIDLDQERVFYAEQGARELGINNVRFMAMNGESMGFRNDSFDVVIADEMIHHCKRLLKMFQEIRRVLKKGGVVVVSDHNKWSVSSEIVRFFYFGKNRQKLYSAKEVCEFLKQSHFNDIAHEHIIFTAPFSRMPSFLLKLNVMLESVVEKMPLLKYQCGLYVVRGII